MALSGQWSRRREHEGLESRRRLAHAAERTAGAPRKGGEGEGRKEGSGGREEKVIKG
jgi:hypothetical protein